MGEAKKSAKSWLEIIANLGIVLGLFIVAFQVAQEDEIATIEYQSERFSKITNHYEKLTGEDPALSLARAIDNPSTLSTRDHIVLHNLYMAEFAKAMRDEQLDGFQPSRAAVTRWSWMIGNPYGFAWWNTVGHDLARLFPQLHRELSRVLKESETNPAHQFQSQVQAINEYLAELEYSDDN